ncbi:MAG: hypothetical protein M1823_005424 [Watsoniomyces obsoletus]|nr:MAG: hypothetical protein M1823_005424 [Watsoniomyces obsoletus]
MVWQNQPEFPEASGTDSSFELLRLEDGAWPYGCQGFSSNDSIRLHSIHNPHRRYCRSLRGAADNRELKRHKRAGRKDARHSSGWEGLSEDDFTKKVHRVLKSKGKSVGPWKIWKDRKKYFKTVNDARKTLKNMKRRIVKSKEREDQESSSDDESDDNGPNGSGPDDGGPADDGPGDDGPNNDPDEEEANGNREDQERSEAGRKSRLGMCLLIYVPVSLDDLF